MAVTDEAPTPFQRGGEGSQRVVDGSRLQQELGIVDVGVEEVPARLGISAESGADHRVLAQRLGVATLGGQGPGKIGARCGEPEGVGRRAGALEDVDDHAGQPLGFPVALLFQEHPDQAAQRPGRGRRVPASVREGSAGGVPRRVFGLEQPPLAGQDEREMGVELIEPGAWLSSVVGRHQGDQLAAQRLGLGVMPGGVQQNHLRVGQKQAIRDECRLGPPPVAARGPGALVLVRGPSEGGFRRLHVSERRVFDRQVGAGRNEEPITRVA